MSNCALLIDVMSSIDDIYLKKYFDMKAQHAKTKPKIKNVKWAVTIAACLVMLISLFSLALNISNSSDMGEIGDYRVSLSDVIYEGIRISEEESSKYLKEHETNILSFVAKSENVNVSSLRLIDNGVYHVTLTNKQNIINYNMITFYVVNDKNEIISSVDLYRDGSNLGYSINIASTGFDVMNSLFSEQPNTSFAMIYVGYFVEALIAPDNTVYFLNGTVDIPKNIDYYSIFNQKVNLIRSDLLK